MNITSKDDAKTNLDKITKKFEIIYKKYQNSEVYSEQEFSSAFEYIYYNKSKNERNIVEKGFNYKFVKIVCYIINNCYEKCVQLFLNSNTITKEDIFFKATLEYCIRICRSFSNVSNEFKIKFQKNKGVEGLFKYISDQTLLDNYIKVANNKQDPNCYFLYTLIRGSIGVLNNLSRTIIEFKPLWDECKAVEILLKISEKLLNVNDCKVAIYMTLANIVDDNQINSLSNLHQVIPVMTYLIGLCAETIQSKVYLKRYEFELEESSNKATISICCIDYLQTNWHFVELIDSLYRMAVNDKIKFEIYETYSMKNHLRTIIYEGNEFEIEYSLKMLHQLCFDKRILEDVYNDKKLFEYIEHLKVNSKKVIKQTEGIIWLINKNLRTQTKNIEETINQIMISYNRGSRDMILKIKDELEKSDLGFKIWIDVESIHGSSLDSMAKAIEQSQIVIMGMTEKYKESNNCRAEAEYAFQLNKKIIPLILQPNYQPDGWLGIILGSKIFVNFTKYEFNECMRRLKEEIISSDKSINKPVIKKEETIVSNSKPIKINENSFKEWTEIEVDNWLKNKCINIAIVDAIRPCNGIILNQLYKMMLEAPEFFYSSLNSTKKVPLREIALFRLELESLFEH